MFVFFKELLNEFSRHCVLEIPLQNNNFQSQRTFLNGTWKCKIWIVIISQVSQRLCFRSVMWVALCYLWRVMLVLMLCIINPNHKYLTYLFVYVSNKSMNTSVYIYPSIRRRSSWERPYKEFNILSVLWKRSD